MKRTNKKTYGSCLDSLQSLKYLTKTSIQASDKEDLLTEDSSIQVEDPVVEKIPWKALALALFLAVGGVIQLISGVFIFTGHLGREYEDRFCPFLILGMIMFLPGAYHLFIAFAAYKNIPGYSFSSIPDFD